MDHAENPSDLLAALRSGQIDRGAFVRRLAALGLAPAALSSLMAADELLAAAPAAAAPAIPGPPWAGGKKGGSATVSYNGTCVLDPAVSYDEAGYYGSLNHLRGLLFYSGPNLTPAPDLAETMEVNRTATHYRFTIRKGVKFHNGREVTAADFKWTMERTSSPQLASWIGTAMANVSGFDAFSKSKTPATISGIKVTGRYALELVLDRPDVTIPVQLACPPFFVVPQEEVKRLGKSWAIKAFGCGPFKLDNVDQGKSQLGISRFADYYDAPSLPYVDSLTWQWNVTQQLQYLRVLRGESDSAGDGPPPPVLASIKAGPNKDQLQRYNSMSLQWVEFNVTTKPFSDRRVRQAFNYAINRERFRPLQWNPTGRLYPPDLFGFKPGLRTYAYDPDKARALLKAAGYGSGLAITWPLFQGSTGQAEQLMAQDLKAVGVAVTFKKITGSIYDYGTKMQKMYPLWSMGWGMGRPDPSEIVLSLLGTGASSNYGGYSNARIDALGRQATAELDQATRAQIYSDLEQEALDAAAWLFQGVRYWYTFRSKRVQNMNWNAIYYQLWDRTWLTS